MSIETECMVVSLHVSIWTGYKLDKETTKQVVKNASAEDDAARVNKHLIPKKALEGVTKASGALRHHFYNRTLPWKDNGDRLLTRAMYLTFMEEHADLKADFNAAVREFVDVQYPAAKSQAEFRMGTLFKENEYPHVDEVARKFSCHLDIDAVTTAGDFRCAIDNSDEIRAQMEQAMQARITGAMADVWSRLSEIIGPMAERLKGDGIIRKSTMINLRELVKALPALNITNDPNLEKIGQDIENTLLGYDAKDLATKHTKTRNEVGEEAAKIMEAMKGFMGAFDEAA